MTTATMTSTNETPAPLTAATLDAVAELKAAHPEFLLMIRHGNFYAMVESDAEVAARVFGLPPQASNAVFVPYNTVERYLRKLIQAGYRPAFVD